MKFTKTQIIGVLIGRLVMGIVMTIIYYLFYYDLFKLKKLNVFFIGIIIFYWIIYFKELFDLFSSNTIYWQNSVSGFISSTVGNLILVLFVSIVPNLIGKNPLFLIQPILTNIILITIFIISTKNYYKSKIFNIKSFIRTDGQIKKMSYSYVRINKKRLINLTIEFNGNKVTIKNVNPNIGLNYSIGDKISIKYDPQNPKNCVLDIEN